MADATDQNRPAYGLMARLMRAMSAQMATQALRILQQILLVPFFLNAWGVGVYSDWLLINAGVAFLNIFDVGMQQYFSGLLLERRVREDIPGYRRAARIAGFNYLFVIAVIVLAVGSASFAVDWRSVFGVSQLSAIDAYRTEALLAANGLLLLPFGVAGSLYRAHGEYDRGVLVALGNLAIQVAVPMILLMLQQPPTVLAAATIGCSLAGWVIISADQSIRYGRLPWGLAIPTGRELGVIVPQCLYFTVQPVTNWLIVQGPLLILGHAGSPAGTIAFATARTLAGVGRQLTLQLAYPFSVELSPLLIRGDLQPFRRLLENAISIMGIIGGMLAGLTMAVGSPVTALWLRGRIEPPASLIFALAIPVAIGASSQLHQIVLALSNHPRMLAQGLGAYACIGLLLALALAPHFGATGVAAGLGIGEAVALVWYLPSRTSRLVGEGNNPSQVTGILRAILAGALSYTIARLSALIVPPTSYWHLMIFGVLWAVISGGSAFFLLLNASQRRVISQALKQMRRKS